MTTLLTIGKDDIDHADEHPVFCGVTSVLDDGDDVGPLLGHVDEITSTSVREFDGVNGSLGSDNVGDMRYRGTARLRQGKQGRMSGSLCARAPSKRTSDLRSGSEVEHLGTRSNVNVVKTSQNTSSQLASERVPDTELGLVLAAICEQDVRMRCEVKGQRPKPDLPALGVAMVILFSP